MAQTPQSKDYLSFMTWFEKNYPEMFSLHRETIIMPVDGEGVTVNKDGMEMNTYKKMIAITQEFYKRENT